MPGENPMMWWVELIGGFLLLWLMAGFITGWFANEFNDEW
jgi:biotin transporter BioY